MMKDELLALYNNVIKELENNMKFIQDHRGTKSAWDMDIINTLVISNRVLVCERNDIGEILWHSGIDAQHQTPVTAGVVTKGEKK